MKWLAKTTDVPIKEGATRLQRKFSFLPTRIGDTFVWLETYEILQLFHVELYTVTIDEKQVQFVKGDWINLSKRIIE